MTRSSATAGRASADASIEGEHNSQGDSEESGALVPRSRVFPTSVLIAAEPGRAGRMTATFAPSVDIEVVGRASTANEMMRMVRLLRPDLVVVDLDLEGGGVAVIERLMRECPTPLVAFMERRANDPLALDGRFAEAFGAGALGVVREEASTAAIVRSVCTAFRGRAPQPPPPARVVAVAASVGGPGALHDLLSCMPSNFSIPILVAQHLAEGFIEGFASWLDGAGTLQVKVAERGDLLEGGFVYVAPHDFHLALNEARRIELSTAAPVGGFRPAATVLFEEVARFFGTTAIAVVLSGLGSDGLAGLRHVRAQGGRILAQDEASSAAHDMPAAAIRAGLCDAVLPIPAIAECLVKWSQGASS